MPKPGLSLVGFVSDAAQAVWHLQRDCVPAPAQASEAALMQEWQQARARIGSCFPRAGTPEILPIPDEFQSYLDALRKQPWMAEGLRELEGASFRLVEIEPLLCHQLTIGMSRVGQVCAGLSGPTIAGLIETCLPMTHPELEHTASSVELESSSIIVKSPRGDLHIGRFGMFTSRADVILLGARLYVLRPFVHVARVGGRCHLLNGYHRVFGARLAGATHIPCVFTESPDHRKAGIECADPENGDFRFPVSLLTSDNPPTVGHFTQGRAHEVALRVKSRIIHVSWHQYTLDEE